MLELGVDEMTVVLQPSPNAFLPGSDWDDVAKYLIKKFVKTSYFVDIFGEKTSTQTLPAGYTVGYTFGKHSFYIAVAYHPDQKNMGVIVKFSAQSLDYYLQRTGERVYTLFQKIQSDRYLARISRLDFTADYIDENIDVTEIYQDYLNDKICICHRKKKANGEMAYRKQNVRFNGFLKEKEVPTIYIGSPRSMSEMRIYDKKREQIERRGTRYKQAKACKNWVRFEGIFKYSYAHQLSDALLQVKDDAEMANLIAETLAQRYSFVYVDNGVIEQETKYTEMLFKCITNQSFTLKAPVSANNDLGNNINHLFYGSGIIPTLYKIKTVWGDEGLALMLQYMDQYVREYVENDQCRYWLSANVTDYRMNYPTFEEFFAQNFGIRT